MGSSEKNIVKQAFRFGTPLPERIKNAPSLRIGLSLYYEAFFELDSERSIGMMLGSIPRSKIIDYADRYEFGYELTEDFVYLIRAMDNAHLAKMREKNEQKST